MTPERWQRIEQLYHAALERDASQRAAFLSEVCAGDAALRQEVESLLAHEDTAERFMGVPALEVAAKVLGGDRRQLLAGRQIGAYEIRSLLGAGGMGEVYRARDTKLNREVALKVLSDTFTRDPDRLARLKREARVLASLNHPHIGAIYGFEDGGETPALVLELVEGPTLAEKLAELCSVKSQLPGLPLDEALSIARQVADALEAAHGRGIIHRDLKPANIKITPDGLVKVLDFGLAKLAHPDAAPSPTDVMASPTITSPPVMTDVGMIVGTAAYMSPEQARGKPVDKRADIWAFGCVLYEMLAGKRAFDGEDVGMMMASVIKGEPDWAALPADVPSAIVTLLRTCLEKERRSRIADIGAATFVLDHAAQLVERVEVPVAALRPGSVPRQPLWRRATPIAATAGMAALLAGTGVWFLTRPAAPSVVRTTITTSGSTALTLSGVERGFAITPDGSRVVYRGNNQLLVRALNELEPTVLSGLGDPRGPFISPDGQWVGFFDGITMKKVALTGGPPVTIAVCGGPRGATWGPDGSIIFATGEAATGLQRVSAGGSEPAVLTMPDRERGEGDHLWPEFLPGGGAVLYTMTPANGGIEDAQVAVLDLQTGRSRVLIRGGSHAHYVPTGHLVYGVTGKLRAVAFDLRRLEVVGTPAPVLEGVVTTGFGAAEIAVAANGSLFYVPGEAGGGGRQSVVLVDRQGRAAALPGLPPDQYGDVRVSPDGARFAVATEADVWTYDFTRATLSRLTTDPAPDHSPLWTPDGQRIIFTSRRAGYPELFVRPADGTGSDERILARAKDLLNLRADSWSADDARLLFTEVPRSRQGAIGQIAIERPSDANVLLKSDFSNDYAAVSPNGHWMAYRSRVSGRDEIYVERYPELGNRQQISTDGGAIPLWSRDSRELYFGSPDGRRMFAVAVDPGTKLVAGRAQVLFDFAMLVPAAGNRPYDIAPDGRFLIIRSGQGEAGGLAPQIVVVQNWFDELKRLVPVN